MKFFFKISSFPINRMDSTKVTRPSIPELLKTLILASFDDFIQKVMSNRPSNVPEPHLNIFTTAMFDSTSFSQVKTFCFCQNFWLR